MWRHQNMSQVGEIDESKLMDDTVFRTIFIRLLKNLLKTAEELEETFKDLNENTKRMEKDQSEIMHTLSEIKNIQSRPPHLKSQTKDLEYEEEKTPNQRGGKKEESKRLTGFSPLVEEWRLLGEPQRLLYCNVMLEVFAFVSSTLLLPLVTYHVPHHPLVPDLYEVNYKCKKCGKYFREIFNLIHHRSPNSFNNQVHTGEKLYECRDCRMSFNQSSTITPHQRVCYAQSSGSPIINHQGAFSPMQKQRVFIQTRGLRPNGAVQGDYRCSAYRMPS
ncbi:hypothetical protein QTO34_014155 [Cnephaeus nilssonii]|uniref:C2H2-type domain-containing protein n=1 Tax=Cnephaeus nilssonii TaxID=3371016 RepID=A0AA40HB14_CNENI|nr:hypothetical protein QTO34_014155 [Eptesicus nilssonii]